MNDTTQNEQAQDVATGSPKVIIYSTTWCAFCKTEKQYLDKKGVAYVEKDVEEDKAAYEELLSKNKSSPRRGFIFIPRRPVKRHRRLRHGNIRRDLHKALRRRI